MTEPTNTPARMNGKHVRCQICHDHDAVERFRGVLVCRNCLWPMAIRYMIDRSIMAQNENTDVQADR